MAGQKLGLALATAMLWIGFGVGGWAEAAGIELQTPAGLSPGDDFRFAFATAGGGNLGPGNRDATSSDITVYNSFVNTFAGGATYNSTVISLVAIASTPSKDAIDNVGLSLDPVYLPDGTLVTTSTTSSGLWSGSLLHPIHQILGFPDVGVQDAAIWTGTDTTGHATTTPLGSPTVATLGLSGHNGGQWVDSGSIQSTLLKFGFYAISSELVVPQSVVPEPSSLWMAGIAISAGLAYGWYRPRRDQRWQKPVGPPDATE